MMATDLSMSYRQRQSATNIGGPSGDVRRSATKMADFQEGEKEKDSRGRGFRQIHRCSEYYDNRSVLIFSTIPSRFK